MVRYPDWYRPEYATVGVRVRHTETGADLVVIIVKQYKFIEWSGSLAGVRPQYCLDVEHAVLEEVSLSKALEMAKNEDLQGFEKVLSLSSKEAKANYVLKNMLLQQGQVMIVSSLMDAFDMQIPYVIFSDSNNRLYACQLDIFQYYIDNNIFTCKSKCYPLDRRIFIGQTMVYKLIDSHEKASKEAKSMIRPVEMAYAGDPETGFRVIRGLLGAERKALAKFGRPPYERLGRKDYRNYLNEALIDVADWIDRKVQKDYEWYVDLKKKAVEDGVDTQEEADKYLKSHKEYLYACYNSLTKDFHVTYSGGRSQVNYEDVVLNTLWRAYQRSGKGVELFVVEPATSKAVCLDSEPILLNAQIGYGSGIGRIKYSPESKEILTRISVNGGVENGSILPSLRVEVAIDFRNGGGHVRVVDLEESINSLDTLLSSRRGESFDRPSYIKVENLIEDSRYRSGRNTSYVYSTMMKAVERPNTSEMEQLFNLFLTGDADSFKKVLKSAGLKVIKPPKDADAYDTFNYSSVIRINESTFILVTKGHRFSLRQSAEIRSDKSKKWEQRRFYEVRFRLYKDGRPVTDCWGEIVTKHENGYYKDNDKLTEICSNLDSQSFLYKREPDTDFFIDSTQLRNIEDFVKWPNNRITYGGYDPDLFLPFKESNGVVYGMFKPLSLPCLYVIIKNARWFSFKQGPDYQMCETVGESYFNDTRLSVDETAIMLCASESSELIANTQGKLKFLARHQEMLTKSLPRNWNDDSIDLRIGQDDLTWYTVVRHLASLPMQLDQRIEGYNKKNIKGVLYS